MAEERKIKSKSVGYLGDSIRDEKMLLFVHEISTSYLIDVNDPFVRGISTTPERIYKVTKYDPNVAGSIRTSDWTYFVELEDKSKLSKILASLNTQQPF